MTRWKKILLALVGFVFVFFILLLALAKVLITPERVRETVIPMVAESLHRDLQLGDIEISLFSGIVLHDVILNDKEGDKAFVSVEKAVLRYRLLPLLLLNVEVDELSLERPHIQMTRFKNGTLSFDDMIGSATEVEHEKLYQSHGSGGSPVTIHVSEIAISDGTIVFVDQAAGEGGRHTLSALNLNIYDFSTSEPFQLSLVTDWNSDALGVNGEFDLDDRSVDVSLQLNDIALQIKGDLLADVKGDRLRTEIGLASMEITSLFDSLPDRIVSIPTGLDFSGRLAAQFVLDGLVSEPTKLLRSGQVDFDNVGVRSSSIQSGINGQVILEQMSIKTEQLLLTVNGEPVNITGQVDDFLNQPLKANFRIKSARFDLDRIMPEVKQETGKGSSSQPVIISQELGPFDLPVELTAAIQIDELLYRKLSIQNIDTQLTLKQNRLIIDRMIATVAGGTIEPTAEIDLGVAGLKYTSQAKLKQIQINPIVKAFKPELSESLYGEMTGRFSLHGAGTVPVTLKKNMQGNGEFDFNQAKLTRIPALDSAARLLSVPELTEIVIDKGQVAVKINKQIVDLDFNTKGSDFEQQTTGTTSFSGQLTLRVKLALSPHLGKKLDRRKVLGEVLTDKRGWTHIPLRVKGDYASPNVVLDTTAMARQAQQDAVERLSDRLKKKLDRSDSKSEVKADDDPAAKLIDSALKSLFGK